MKEKLLYLVWSIYREIVYSGLEEGISRDQRKKIIRFNQFTILALLVNFLSVISYFYHKLYISALVNITSAYFSCWHFISVQESVCWQGAFLPL